MSNDIDQVTPVSSLRCVRFRAFNYPKEYILRRRNQTHCNRQLFLFMHPMVAAFHIHPIRTDADLAATSKLFEGYAASLPVDLGYQAFEVELAGLPGKYAPPHGALLLARDSAGEALGCVALRPLSVGKVCEMKRLYLLPDARGMGLGRAMAEAIINEAKRLGYREMWLDTLPTMTGAIRLYEQIGFGRISPYYAPTPTGTVFMALKL